jgi:uncharacterized protein involved in exopolysaccharide biosynthesis
MGEKDEITLKDLILKLKEFWAEIWDKKWWVVGAGLLFGLISGVNAYLKPTLYNASLTFMVNDDEGGGGMAEVVKPEKEEMSITERLINIQALVTIATSTVTTKVTSLILIRELNGE